MICWVDCQECGQPVEYRTRGLAPRVDAKEFNTVDLRALRQEREDFRENRWVQVWTFPGGKPIYVRKYDAAYF